METVTVLLASAQRGLCRSLRSMLEDEAWIEIVGTSDSKRHTLDMVEKLGPQIIILGLDLAGDELEVGHEALERSPDSKIIVLNPHDYTSQINVKRSAKDPGAIEQRDLIADKKTADRLIRSLAGARRKGKKRRLH